MIFAHYLDLSENSGRKIGYVRYLPDTQEERVVEEFPLLKGIVKRYVFLLLFVWSIRLWSIYSWIWLLLNSIVVTYIPFVNKEKWHLTSIEQVKEQLRKRYI